jgi:hypothetical protein
MTLAKAVRPAFQSIELDPIDARLEARAAEKGIPTLVTPKTETPPEAVTLPAANAEITPPPKKPSKAIPHEATPRSRMKSLKIELPDYSWVALKKRTAEEMVSLRYFIMEALREKGIPINDIDMVEDGRRFRD